MKPNRSVIRLISMDFGVYSTKELLRRGSSTWQIRRHTQTGVLVGLRRGWYATATADPDVVAAVRAGGVLACVSALRKHKLWVAPGYRQVHIRSTRDGELKSSQACTGLGRPSAALTAVDPIPVALLTAAKCMTAEHWIAACDSALNTAGLTVSQMASEMGPSAGRISRLLAKCDPASQSGTESITRVRLRAVFDCSLRAGPYCELFARHVAAARPRSSLHRPRPIPALTGSTVG